MPVSRYYLPPAIAILLLNIPPLHAAGKDDPQWLEELRQLSQQARQRNAADRWLLRSLDDLVARYESPWKRAILYEDFSDGDFTRNPGWQVLEGDFQVLRGQGLNSTVRRYRDRPQTTTPSKPQQAPETALGDLIVGALLERALGPDLSSPGTDNTAPAIEAGDQDGPNRIRLKADVSNAFSMLINLRTRNTDDTQIELALLQSTQARYGYRLRLQTGPRGFVELERIRGGRGAIIGSKSLDAMLDDQRFHDIGWAQLPDGTVTLTIDGQEVFTIRDRAFRDGYPWLALDHLDGELTVRSLRIDGV